MSYEELYKEFLWLTCNDEQATSTALGEAWNPSEDWDSRYDDIPEEEWLETLEIHRQQRERLINKLLKGSNNGN